MLKTSTLSINYHPKQTSMQQPEDANQLFQYQQQNIMRIQQLQARLTYLRRSVQQTLFTQPIQPKQIQKLHHTIIDNILQLDKFISQDYNINYMKQMQQLVHFVIPSIELRQTQQYFVQNIRIQPILTKQFPYFARLVFIYNKNCYNYNMHIQLWNNDGLLPTTSNILSYLERYCTKQLLEYLLENNYVEYYDKNCVVVKNNYAQIMSVITQRQWTNNFMNFVTVFIKDYLRDINRILMQQVCCKYCKKYYMYTARVNMMVPPIRALIIQNKPNKYDWFGKNNKKQTSKQKQKQNERNRMRGRWKTKQKDNKYIQTKIDIAQQQPQQKIQKVIYHEKCHYQYLKQSTFEQQRNKLQQQYLTLRKQKLIGNYQIH